MCSRPRHVIIPPHPTPLFKAKERYHPTPPHPTRPLAQILCSICVRQRWWIQWKKFLNRMKKSFWIRRTEFLNPRKKVSESDEKSFWIRQKKVSESDEKSFWIRRTEFLNPGKFLNPTLFGYFCVFYPEWNGSRADKQLSDGKYPFQAIVRGIWNPQGGSPPKKKSGASSLGIPELSLTV